MAPEDNGYPRNDDLISDQNSAPEPAGQSQRMGPWGLWSTLGLTALLIVMYLVFQAISIVGLLGLGAFGEVPDGTNKFMEQYATHGALLGWATFIAGLAASALTVMFMRVRDISLKEYLALNECSKDLISKWIFLSLFLVIFTDVALNYLIDRPFLPEWWIRVWNSGKSSVGLYMGFLIAAPIFEEGLFRGFAYKGIADSKAGPWTAILLTAVVWGLLHSQYELVDTVYVMLCGLLLGVARWQTGSLYTTVAMHGFINLLAMIQVAWLNS